MMRAWLRTLEHDLESPVEARGFGSGWLSGFLGLVLAVTGLCLVVSLRWPVWTAMPEMDAMRAMPWFRGFVHAVLLAAYALALLSLLLRKRKAIGFAALIVVLGATLLGGANVQAHETRDWGIFFGVDFFVVNLVATGFMFAPIERLFPRNRGQRLFRPEWGEDLFYYLVSTMMVQLINFLALAPSAWIMANTGSFGAFRAAVAAQPWLVQFVEVMILSDFAQYWFQDRKSVV